MGGDRLRIATVPIAPAQKPGKANGAVRTAQWERAKCIADAALERGKQRCDPYEGINRVLNKEPRVITLEEIIDIYALHALRNGETPEQMQTGMQQIEKAYRFAERAFAEQVRKDGKTPKFAHSTRLAAMMAHFGADSKLISGILLHDTVEDCPKVTFRKLRKKFGREQALFVALMTKPLLYEIQGGNKVSAFMGRITGDDRFQLQQGLQFWVHPAKNMKLWEHMRRDRTDRYGEERYEDRLNRKFDECLNIHAPSTTAELKIKAFLGICIDALDSLSTDQYLDPTRADIRLRMLITKLRYVKVLAPGLEGIIQELLKERDYAIPEMTTGKKPHESVILVRPLYIKGSRENLSTAYLREHPAPNGSILVYAGDEQMQQALDAGRLNEPIRIELPHDAPADSHRILLGFSLRTEETGFEFAEGKSILPPAVDGAGKIVWVDGIHTREKYEQLLRVLERFHETKLIEGKGIVPNPSP